MTQQEQQNPSPTPAAPARRGKQAKVEAAFAEISAAELKVARRRARIKREREGLQRDRVALELTIARAVSSEPGAVDWYRHPGVLTDAQTAGAAGLDAVMRRVGEQLRDAAGLDAVMRRAGEQLREQR